MARTRYGRPFRTRRGRFGRYKYVNGRRVGFVANTKKRRVHGAKYGKGYRKNNRRYHRSRRY